MSGARGHVSRPSDLTPGVLSYCLLVVTEMVEDIGMGDTWGLAIHRSMYQQYMGPGYFHDTMHYCNTYIHVSAFGQMHPWV